MPCLGHAGSRRRASGKRKLTITFKEIAAETLADKQYDLRDLTTVDALLDDIYRTSLSGYFDPRSYGEQWLLVTKGGESLWDIGRQHALRQGLQPKPGPGVPIDDRLVASLPWFRPGAVLRVQKRPKCPPPNKLSSVQMLQGLQQAKQDQDLVVEAAKNAWDNLNRSFHSGVIDIGPVLNSLVDLWEARIKSKLLDTQIRFVSQLDFIPEVNNPRSNQELAVIANGKKGLEDEIKELLKDVQKQCNMGYLSHTDVLRVESELRRVTAERNQYERSAVNAPSAAEMKG
jgi:hypothetical protein